MMLVTKKENGFSLIEIMVAITILGLVMLAIVSIVGDSQTTKERVTSEDSSRLQVETAFSRIQWDFEHIYSPLYFSHDMKAQEGATENEIEAFNIINDHYVQNDRFAFASYDALPVPIFTLDDKTTFTFFSSSNRRKMINSKSSNFVWVRYYLEDNDQEGALTKNMLVRKAQEQDPFRATKIDWSDLRPQILLRNVKSIAFEFWDKKKRKWTDNLDTIENGNHLIRGIKITIEWLTNDDIELKFVRVYRPLFPYFEPENMYELKKASNPAGTNNTTNGSGTSGTSGSTNTNSSGSTSGSTP